jgi:hypothetical protein
VQFRQVLIRVKVTLFSNADVIANEDTMGIEYSEGRSDLRADAKISKEFLFAVGQGLVLLKQYVHLKPPSSRPASELASHVSWTARPKPVAPKPLPA